MPTLAQAFNTWHRQHHPQAAIHSGNAPRPIHEHHAQGDSGQVIESLDHEHHLPPLVYDNRPQGLLDAFPAAATEQELQDQLWWWRKANPQERHQIFNLGNNPHWPVIMQGLFEDHWKRSALLYEINARFNGRGQWAFGKPYPFISQEQRRFLSCRWPQDNPARNWNPSESDNPVFCRIRRSFNVACQDGVLVEQFMAEIVERRRVLGVARAGQDRVPNREMSWRPVELMDTRRFDLRVLNASERSQLSRALRVYEAACVEADIEA